MQPNGQVSSCSGWRRVRSKSGTAVVNEDDDDTDTDSSGCRVRTTHNSCLTIPLLASIESSHTYTGKAKSTESLTLTLKIITSSSSSPRLSNHQPCPNHVVGKTFSEQGTQTLKEDKAAAAGARLVSNGKCRAQAAAEANRVGKLQGLILSILSIEFLAFQQER
jgi:hypothetical protein